MKGYKKNSKYYQNAQKFFQSQIIYTIWFQYVLPRTLTLHHGLCRLQESKF